VPQRTFLFSGTIASNLRLGGPTPPRRDVAALDAAQASEFVRRLPEGLGAPVGRAAGTSPAGSASG
jgi:ATP-binding cassette subfamily B protein